MTSTLQAYFQRSGYDVDVENDPYRAIERVREKKYDILLLDFLMSPICGNQVVEEIRKFNQTIYIILLTGHKSMAPPIKTIRELDIQAYYEKNDRFDQLELLVESCVKSIRQLRKIRSYERGLSQILESMPQIYHFQNTGKMAELILDKMEYFVPVEESFLLFGKDEDVKLHKRKMKTKTEISQHLYSQFEEKNYLERDGFTLFPLWSEMRECIGVLGVKCSRELKSDQIQLLRIFLRQAAAAFVNSKLHSELNEAYLGTVSTLRYAVEAKDYETRGHSDRVSKMSAMFSEYLGKDAEFVKKIRIAGLFHDVGKIGVPDQILVKPTKLTEEEFAEIKKHPEIGAKIISGLMNSKELVPIVRGHHERVDGRGYPDGLKDRAIPEGAKIIAITDSFDAMVSNRQYRRGKSWEEALAEIERNKGSQFDEKLADAFIRMLAERLKVIKMLYGMEENRE